MSDLVMSALAPTLFALLCWWFGTGAILWLVRRPAHTQGLRTAGMTVLLLASLGAAWWSMGEASVRSAYVAFASVIAMWSWHEFAFLSGWITGPRREPLTPGARGSARFAQALQVILHHELVLLGNFGLLLLLQQGQPSHVALCTYALLWCMRLSAKLNLFFGVPDVGEQYLPAQLRYLASYFRRGRVSMFFFLTVLAASLLWAWMVWQAGSGAVAISTGWVLLAALLGLAIVEHLLMAFPLPLQRLWGWAMPPLPPLRASTANGTSVPVVAVVPAPAQVDRG